MDNPNTAASDSQKDAENNEGVTHEQSPSIKPEIKDSPPTQPATEEQLLKTEQAIEQRMSAFERTMLRLTRTGIIVGIVTGVIFLGQLYEMYEAGSQTDKMLAAAKALASAAGDQAQAAEDTAAAAGDQVDAGNNFADTAEDINKGIADVGDRLQSAADNAKAGIQATQDAMRLDQRAWVGIKFAHITDLAPQQSMRIVATVVNTGKTFALSTTVDGVLKSSHVPLNIDEYAKTLPPVKPPSVSTLFPGLPVEVPVTSSQVLNEATVAAVKVGVEYVYFFGDIKYRDIFGVHHLTRFCFSYYTPEGTLKDCDQHNYAN